LAAAERPTAAAVRVMDFILSVSWQAATNGYTERIRGQLSDTSCIHSVEIVS